MSTNSDHPEQNGDLTSFALAGGLGIGPDSVSAARTSAHELPERLCARYQLEGVLGAGGMGVIYRARDMLCAQFGEPDPYVAIKLMGDDLSEAPDADVLLYSEFALTRHLRHPNVVKVDTFDVDPASRRAFFTQELMRGKTLEALLCEQPTGLAPFELQDIAVPLLDALAHCHERGVVHGDLKPGNLMLTDDGPRLFDFGLGQATKGALSKLPRLSKERFKAWTPRYAAPELLEEGGMISLQTDVFAMGCVLFEVAGGKHPFGTMLSTQARAERRWDQLRAPENLPVRFWPALRLALNLDANRRTITAQELHDAFCTVPIGKMQF